MTASRPYSMTVRGAQAEATRERILAATRALFDTQSPDMTLNAVARAAETSVQTVLRIFGSKAALLDAALGSVRDGVRGVISSPESIAPTITSLFDDYERIGDRVIRVLADEHRVPGFAQVARVGREDHRAWVQASFARQLAACHPPARDQAVLALVAATDVYVWKLLRRDLGLTRASAEVVVVRLCTVASRD